MKEQAKEHNYLLGFPKHMKLLSDMVEAEVELILTIKQEKELSLEEAIEERKLNIKHMVLNK